MRPAAVIRWLDMKSSSSGNSPARYLRKIVLALVWSPFMASKNEAINVPERVGKTAS
jgi:hypothetical protein